MKLSTVLYWLGVFVLVAACRNNSNLEELEKKSKLGVEGEYKPVQNEAFYERKIYEIDSDTSLLEVGSLYYTKEDGSSYEVFAFLDANKRIVKLVENYVDGASGKYGKNVFYFDEGKKIVSNEHFEEKVANQSKFVERISYYKKNGHVVGTKIRVAKFEEDLDKIIYEKSKLTDCMTTNAENALNQEGSFETTFQGFVQNGNQHYLIVGEPKKDGFVSALLVQYYDSNIKKLISQEAVMMGKKLRVSFQKMKDDDGFQFQVLMAVAFDEKK